MNHNKVSRWCAGYSPRLCVCLCVYLQPLTQQFDLHRARYDIDLSDQEDRYRARCWPVSQGQSRNGTSVVSHISVIFGHIPYDQMVAREYILVVLLYDGVAAITRLSDSMSPPHSLVGDSHHCIGDGARKGDFIASFGSPDRWLGVDEFGYI